MRLVVEERGYLVAAAGSDWTTAITALSTVSAAAIGALAGYLGAARASKQAVAIAREQRRYERVHEMRSEVLPTLYAHLQTIYDLIGSLTKTPFETNEEGKVETPDQDLEGEGLTQIFDKWGLAQLRIAEILKQYQPDLEQIGKEVEEFYEYYKRHTLWVPDLVRNPLGTAFNGVETQLLKLRQLAETLVDVPEWELAHRIPNSPEMRSRSREEIVRATVSDMPREELARGIEQFTEVYVQTVRAFGEADSLRREVKEWRETVGQELLDVVRTSAEYVLNYPQSPATMASGRNIEAWLKSKDLVSKANGR
jgi:hypothetical protein